MRWFSKPTKDMEIVRAQREAEEARKRIELSEKAADRLQRERIVTNLALQDNERRWRNHREPNGWDEIVEDQIKLALKRDL